MPLFLSAQLASECPAASQVDSLIQLSRSFTHQYQLDTAAVLSAQAAALARNSCGELSAAYGAACFNEGRVRHFAGDYEGAIPWYVRSKDIRATVLGTDDLEYGKSLNNLAIVYDQQGKYDQAEWLYLQALTLRKRALGRESRPYSKVLNNLATMYRSMGRFEQAEQLLHENLTIRRKVEGDTTLNYANSLRNLGDLYYQLHQNQRAQTYFQQALHIYDNLGYQQSQPYLALLNSLGSVYYDTNQPEQALAYFTEALALAEALFGTDHPEYAGRLNALALVHAELGQVGDAEMLYQKALAKSADYPLNYGYYAHNLVRLYYQKGDLDQAKRWQDSTTVYLNTHLAPGHPRQLQNQRLAGEIKWAKGEPAAAAAVFADLARHERQRIAKASRHLSDQELLTYLRSARVNLNFQLSLLHEVPTYSELAYD
ncbi:MAG: tetratricopeptide repeat protein, partial [Bacteroidetes bacterium]